MAVILANCALSAHVLDRPWVRDAMGVAYPGPASVTVRGPYPGSVKVADGGAGDDDTPDGWTLRADPRLGPLRRGDKLTDGARTWVLITARTIAVPGAGAADYIACTGTLDLPEVR